MGQPFLERRRCVQFRELLFLLVALIVVATIVVLFAGIVQAIATVAALLAIIRGIWLLVNREKVNKNYVRGAADAIEKNKSSQKQTILIETTVSKEKGVVEMYVRIDNCGNEVVCNNAQDSAKAALPVASKQKELGRRRNVRSIVNGDAIES